MENIFKDAKFGDKFRTRDGRMAILLQTHNCAVIAINFDSYAVTHDYKMDGTSVFNCHDLDIVSKWQEPINEKELKELARHFADDEMNISISERNGRYAGYQAGYRKAKNQ